MTLRGAEVTVVQSVGRDQWTELGAGFADYNYEQSYSYSASMATGPGAASRFLAVRQGGSVIGAASVRIRCVPLLGRGIAYVSGGPLIHERNAGGFDAVRLATVLAALKATLVEGEGHNLYVRPATTPPVDIARLDATYQSAGFRMSHHRRSYSTVLVDLFQDARRLRSGLHKKWRYELTRSEQEGLHIEIGDDESVCERFMGIYREMRQQKLFESRIMPEFFLQLPKEELGLTVLIALRDGQPVGGHVLSVLGSTAIYLFGATNSAGRNARAGYLLHWEAMSYAKARGCSWYDLGGVDPIENPGGFLFKTRMGGRLTEVCTYEARAVGLAATLADKLLEVRNRVKGR